MAGRATSSSPTRPTRPPANRCRPCSQRCWPAAGSRRRPSSRSSAPRGPARCPGRPATRPTGPEDMARQLSGTVAPQARYLLRCRRWCRDEGREAVVRRVVCPGSFDPVTNGHLDIISRAASLHDEVVVAVLINVTKHSLFTVDERVEMLSQVTSNFGNVKIERFHGLLV